MIIYRVIYFFARAIISLIKPLLPKKMRRWVDLRNGPTDYFRQNLKNPVWFHAASGEIEYCKAIISEIKNMNGERPIILTYSSPSAEKLFFNVKEDLALIFPLPWDSPSKIKKLVKHLKPCAVIFSRTDFWPELIHELATQKVPLAAVSMFPRMGFANRVSYRLLLKKFKLITLVESGAVDFFKKLSGPRVLHLADSRFDQVLRRLADAPRITLGTHPKKIVFGSTWPEDEEVLFPTLPSLLGENFQVVIAPHEADRSLKIFNELSIYDPVLFSQVSTDPSRIMRARVLIIDQVGLLADAYRFSDIAFVGGSFKKKIHSVMEPLCAKNIVLMGPSFANNPEAVEAARLGFAFVVETSEDIIHLVKSFTPDLVQKMRLSIEDFSQKKKGSSKVIALEILRLIEENTDATRL